VDPERLQVADDDVGAVARRRLEHAERQRVDADDRLGVVRPGEPRDLRARGLDHAERRRVLEVDRRGRVRELALDVGDVQPTRRRVLGDRDEHDPVREALGTAVRADHGEPLRVERGRVEHLAPPGEPCRHADRVAGRAAEAVDRQPHEVHVEQLAEHALELEPGLVRAVVGRGRPPDRRQELGAGDDLVDDGRHVMLVAAAAEEAQRALAVVVPRHEVEEVAAQVGLRAQGAREIEGPRHAVRGRDLLEQRLGVVDADRVEQRLPRGGRRVRHVRVGFAWHGSSGARSRASRPRRRARANRRTPIVSARGGRRRCAGHAVATIPA
jgi:hypothetical protein